MRKPWLNLAALLALVLVGVGAIFHDGAAQEKRWAAIDPNNETTSPVAWSSTEAKARQEAVDACKRTSKSCANGYGHIEYGQGSIALGTRKKVSDQSRRERRICSLANA